MGNSTKFITALSVMFVTYSALAGDPVAVDQRLDGTLSKCPNNPRLPASCGDASAPLCFEQIGVAAGLTDVVTTFDVRIQARDPDGKSVVTFDLGSTFPTTHVLSDDETTVTVQPLSDGRARLHFNHHGDRSCAEVTGIVCTPQSKYQSPHNQAYCSKLLKAKKAVVPDNCYVGATFSTDSDAQHCASLLESKFMFDDRYTSRSAWGRIGISFEPEDDKRFKVIRDDCHFTNGSGNECGWRG